MRQREIIAGSRRSNAYSLTKLHACSTVKSDDAVVEVFR